MRKYFETIQKRPPHHKKRFAFMAASTITLSIFAVWSLVTFGVSDGIFAKDNTQNAQVGKYEEVSPFESFRLNLAASLESLRNTYNKFIKGPDFYGN